jgi:hypothetical protein
VQAGSYPGLGFRWALSSSRRHRPAVRTSLHPLAAERSLPPFHTTTTIGRSIVTTTIAIGRSHHHRQSAPSLLGEAASTSDLPSSSLSCSPSRRRALPSSTSPPPAPTPPFAHRQGHAPMQWATVSSNASSDGFVTYWALSSDPGPSREFDMVVRTGSLDADLNRESWSWWPEQCQRQSLSAPAPPTR